MFTREMALSIYLPASMLSLGTGLVAPILPLYAKAFDISFATATLIIVVHGYGGLVANLPTGYLIDRVGRKPVLIAGPLLTAAAAFLTGFAGSFEELLIYRFISGAAAAMWFQARLTMIADSGGDRERGKMITWLAGTQRFGMLFSPVIGGLIGEWRLDAVFWVHGVLVLLVLLPIIKLAKETAPGRSERGEAAREPADWRYVLSSMMKPQILYFLSAQLLANITRGSFAGIVGLYIAFEFAKGPSTIGFIAAGNAAIVMPLTFVTGIIMDRWGRKMTIVPGFFGLFVTSMALALAASPWVGTSFLLFLVLNYAWHAAQGITAGNMQVLGSDLAPARARGRFFAIQRTAGQTGQATSPLIFGLISAIGFWASFSFVGFAGLAVALIVAFKVKETVGRARASEPEPAPQPPPPQESAPPPPSRT